MRKIYVDDKQEVHCHADHFTMQFESKEIAVLALFPFFLLLINVMESSSPSYILLYSSNHFWSNVFYISVILVIAYFHNTSTKMICHWDQEHIVEQTLLFNRKIAESKISIKANTFTYWIDYSSNYGPSYFFGACAAGNDRVKLFSFDDQHSMNLFVKKFNTIYPDRRVLEYFER